MEPVAPGHGSEPTQSVAGPLRRLLDVCPDAVVLVDDAGVIVQTNRHVEELLGYRSDELVGATLEMLVPEHLRTRHRADRDRYQAAPTARAMADGTNLHARHSDGRHVPVDIALSPVGPLTDRPMTAAFVRDASERRRLEERRRRPREAELARRQALEINDSVIQGLAVIQYALELGDVEGAAAAIERTSVAARELVEQLLGRARERDAAEGSFVRSRPALSGADGAVQT